MELGSISILFDSVMAVLLIATIVYAVKLNRRLEALRSQREELTKLTERFGEATAHADASIVRLRNASQEIVTPLNAVIDKAQALRDELTFIVDRGDAMANRIVEQRPPAAAPPKRAPVAHLDEFPRDPRTARSPAGGEQPPGGSEAGESEMEQNLMEAIRLARTGG